MTQGMKSNLMEYHEWTPKGRIRRDVKPSDYRAKVVSKACDLVRETGYHLVRLIADNAPKDESWSRSCCLYMEACELLFAVDSEAESFCLRTYDPGREYRFLA
jgi:hypothetical protein